MNTQVDHGDPQGPVEGPVRIDYRRRLDEVIEHRTAAQLGGAAGTLASLEGHGSVVVAAFAVASAPALAQTGRIGGTVKDAQNGQPLKGATVTAENPNASPSSFTATTDDRGRYSIIGLRTGTWKITASAPGFAGPQASCVRPS